MIRALFLFLLASGKFPAVVKGMHADQRISDCHYRFLLNLTAELFFKSPSNPIS